MDHISGCVGFMICVAILVSVWGIADHPRSLTSTPSYSSRLVIIDGSK